MGTIGLNRKRGGRGAHQRSRGGLHEAPLKPERWQGFVFFTGFVVATASLVTSTSSCSSSPAGSSYGGGAATPTEIQSLCDAQCARQARCNPGTSASDASAPCATSCVQDLGHLAENVRGDIARALAACYDTLVCGMNDDGCLGQAVVASGESPDAELHSQDVQMCLQKQDACAATSSSFSDDHCGTLILLIPSKRAELARCFDGPCELVPACIDPIVGG
jgi:hypothetical protein